MAWIPPDNHSKPANGGQIDGDWGGMVHDDLKHLYANFPPIGSVLPYAGTSEPTGYLFCRGQAVSRTTYADLFAAIGTTFGAGDGSTTFNLPDLRDRFPLGDNDMGGSDAGRVGNYNTDLGDTGGEDQHTLTTGEIPNHSHTMTKRVVGDGGAGHIGGTSGSTDGSLTTSAVGGGGAHNNMPPFLTLHYIIKY